MKEVEGQTIGRVFGEVARQYDNNPFLMVPRDPDRSYDPDGRTISYGTAAAIVDRFAEMLVAAGYGYGHRIAVLLENRPENLLLKLACAATGVSWVPVNPDYRPAEIA